MVRDGTRYLGEAVPDEQQVFIPRRRAGKGPEQVHSQIRQRFRRGAGLEVVRHTSLANAVPCALSSFDNEGVDVHHHRLPMKALSRRRVHLVRPRGHGLRRVLFQHHHFVAHVGRHLDLRGPVQRRRAHRKTVRVLVEARLVVAVRRRADLLARSVLCLPLEELEDRQGG